MIYDFYIFTFHKFQLNWNKNEDSPMVERQARDLKVRVRIPVQVQIFLLKFMKQFTLTADFQAWFPLLPNPWLESHFKTCCKNC